MSAIRTLGKSAVLTVALLAVSCAPKRSGNRAVESKALTSTPSAAQPRAIELFFSSPMLTYTSSIAVYTNGLVTRNRWGACDGFVISPSLVSDLTRDLAAVGFFEIEESAIKRGIADANVVKRARGEMTPGGLTDGTLAGLVVRRGDQEKTVTFYGEDIYYEMYPMVKDLKALHICVGMVKSNFWARALHFWEELPY